MPENRKIIITRHGESFRECTEIVTEMLRDTADDEVLVRNHFAGVNGVYDQMMCANKVEHTPVEPPADTGVEAIGIVEQVGGSVSSVSIGDAVVTVGAGNGYRRFVLADESSVIKVPEISREILALIPSGVSAMLALEQVGEMQSGEVVLITAAAGGLGNVATQLAVQAGNHVIATCSNSAKAEWLHSIGVRRVVQVGEESLADVLATEYPDKIDLAMDSIGGEIFDAIVEQLAPYGRLVVCGATSDRLPPVKVNHERVYNRLYWKAASVRGFMNYRFSEHAPEARSRLLKMLGEGELTPHCDAHEFRGLEAVADAVDYLLSGKNLGKVIVDMREA